MTSKILIAQEVQLDKSVETFALHESWTIIFIIYTEQEALNKKQIKQINDA